MEALLPLLVLAGVVGAVWSGVSAYRSRVGALNAVWSEAAVALGVESSPASFLARHGLGGTIDGFPLSVDQESDNDSVVTVFSLGFDGPGFPFRLRPESGWTRLGRRLGLRDPEVGDAAFDEATRVKTGDPDRLAVYLTARRRSVASAFLGSAAGTAIEDAEVRVRWSGTPRTVDEIVGTVRAMVVVAAEFDTSPAAEERPLPSLEEELVVVAPPLERVSAIPDAEPVDTDALVADVLDGGRGVMEALEIFEERYAGRPITVTGQVTRSEAVSATGRPAKAVIRIDRLRDGVAGARDVEAHVVLGRADPPGRGMVVTVRGIAERADPLLRRVHVEDAVVD